MWSSLVLCVGVVLSATKAVKEETNSPPVATVPYAAIATPARSLSGSVNVNGEVYQDDSATYGYTTAQSTVAPKKPPCGDFYCECGCGGAGGSIDAPPRCLDGHILVRGICVKTDNLRGYATAQSTGAPNKPHCGSYCECKCGPGGFGGGIDVPPRCLAGHILVNGICVKTVNLRE